MKSATGENSLDFSSKKLGNLPSNIDMMKTEYQNFQQPKQTQRNAQRECKEGEEQRTSNRIPLFGPYPVH